MSDLVKQGRFVANFLNRDEMSSVIHAQTVDDLCDRIEQLERELAAEKALADRLYEAARNYRVRAFHARDKSFIDAHTAYRKARGLE